MVDRGGFIGGGRWRRGRIEVSALDAVPVDFTEVKVCAHGGDVHAWDAIRSAPDEGGG